MFLIHSCLLIKKAVISEDKPTIVLRRNDLHALEKKMQSTNKLINKLNLQGSLLSIHANNGDLQKVVVNLY